MTSERELLMLYQGCEALWRDIKYPVMERSYEMEQQLQAKLQQARGDKAELERWLEAVFAAELRPVSLAGTRNTLFHVFGYFRDSLEPDVRHEWHKLILNEPKRARLHVKELLTAHPNALLLTSYYWRSDGWRISWFRHEKTWWQMRVHDETPRPSVTFTTHAELMTQAPSSIQSVDMQNWLHKHRLAVRFADGEFILYPDIISERPSNVHGQQANSRSM